MKKIRRLIGKLMLLSALVGSLSSLANTTTSCVSSTVPETTVSDVKEVVGGAVEEVTKVAGSLTLQKYDVLNVVDGDTFKIMCDGKKTSVRLIGVDTPESVHSDSSRNTDWGKKASDYTKGLLSGKQVMLEFDVDSHDKYGRLLAYAYLVTKKGNKGKMVNRLLAFKGYARAVCYEPNHKYKDLFEKAERRAKNAKKGFWKDGYNKAFPKN